MTAPEELNDGDGDDEALLARDYTASYENDDDEHEEDDDDNDAI